MKQRPTREHVQELRRTTEKSLRESGERRARMLLELERIEAELRVLMLDASELGMTVREIGALVGMTGSGASKWIVKERQER